MNLQKWLRLILATCSAAGLLLFATSARLPAILIAAKEGKVANPITASSILKETD